MNVSLTPELVKFITQKLDSGLYSSASEVVREGLRLLHQQDMVQGQRLNQLQSDIQSGLDQLDAGQSVDGEVAFNKIRKMSADRRNG